MLQLGITIRFSYETEPLGTAGPLALAAKWLSDSDEPFFMLNSDVICAFPFEALKEAHAKHKGEATIAVHILILSLFLVPILVNYFYLFSQADQS